jgi:hypothetical protein
MAVLRILIRKDPHHLAGSGILDAGSNPDPRLQNWHFLVKKSIVNKFKYIYANFSVHK